MMKKITHFKRPNPTDQTHRNHRNRFMLALLALISVTTLSACQASSEPRQMQWVAPLDRLQLEVADNEAARQVGLMNRTSLPDNAGMLFVFENSQNYCFWMKDTLIPLSIAFIDEQGRLLQMTDMQPQTMEPHCAEKAVKYALEVNQGWFERNRVLPNTQVIQFSK